MHVRAICSRSLALRLVPLTDPPWQVVKLTKDIGENLKLVSDAPVPSPGEGEVLVNITIRCAWQPTQLRCLQCHGSKQRLHRHRKVVGGSALALCLLAPLAQLTASCPAGPSTQWTSLG